MQDPWNPQKEELIVWAYDPDSGWPEQDFDLAVSELYFADLILELASDNNCPKQSFFLSCAYLIVGDAVRTGFQTHGKTEIEKFLQQASERRHPYLDNFAGRSKDLIQHPDTFDYDNWCAGGLAYAEF